MADNKDITEKLEKIQKKIDSLKRQKEEIEAKIKKAQDEYDKYNSILNQKKFNEMNEVLLANGISVNELLAAIKNGDVLSLQEHIEANAAKAEREISVEAGTLLHKTAEVKTEESF